MKFWVASWRFPACLLVALSVRGSGGSYFSSSWAATWVNSNSKSAYPEIHPPHRWSRLSDIFLRAFSTHPTHLYPYCSIELGAIIVLMVPLARFNDENHCFLNTSKVNLRNAGLDGINPPIDTRNLWWSFSLDLFVGSQIGPNKAEINS